MSSVLGNISACLNNIKREFDEKGAVLFDFLFGKRISLSFSLPNYHDPFCSSFFAVNLEIFILHSQKLNVLFL